MSESAPSDNTDTLKQGSQLIVEVGPAAIFMVSYNLARRFVEDQAIYWATGIFMVSVLAAVIYAYTVQKRVPPMLIVTFVIVTLFGGMTIYLQDPIFVYIKPTIINLIFASAILGSLAFGFNVWKALFGSVFELPDRVWKILAIRWGVFYVFLAFLNEVLWRHITDSVVTESARWFEWFSITEGFWVNFKLMGIIPITILFLAANLPITMKYMKEPSEGEGS